MAISNSASQNSGSSCRASAPVCLTGSFEQAFAFLPDVERKCLPFGSLRRVKSSMAGDQKGKNSPFVSDRSKIKRLLKKIILTQKDGNVSISNFDIETAA